MHVSTLIACHECDLLQSRVILKRGEKARCSRCQAILYRHHLQGFRHELAFTITAAVMLFIADVFPIATLYVRGQETEASVIEIINTLTVQQHVSLALLVLATLVVMPALEILSMFYLLFKIKQGASASRIAGILRLRKEVKPWVLVDVFMLGVIVSLVKLTPLATLNIGIATWAFGGVLISFMLTAYVFDEGKIWLQSSHPIQ